MTPIQPITTFSQQNGTSKANGKFTLRLDTSQIVQATKCPTFHDFVSVQNLVRKYQKKEAMDRGTVMHGLLERYYTKLWEGQTGPQAMNHALMCLNDLKKTVSLTDKDYPLLVQRFNEYFVKYYNEAIKIATIQTDKGPKPAIELGFSVPLVDNDDFYFVLEGRIDLITVMSGVNVVWDHKFQGRSYFLYPLSYQALNYMLASGSHMFQFNYCRLHQKIQPNTFFRDFKTVSPVMMAKWREKLIGIFYKIAASRMEGNFIGKDFPNQSCADIGFGKVCPYTSLCEESSDRIRKALIERDFMQKNPWEPWSLDSEGEEEE